MNYFAEIEQIAFSPAHMPPGIEASPDKMLQVRLYYIMLQIILYYIVLCNMLYDILSSCAVSACM